MTKDKTDQRICIPLALKEIMPPCILSGSPRTKGWLFHSLVISSLMYASTVWAPGLLTTPFTWTQLERALVMMLSCQLRSKSTVPHDIIRVEFSLPPMLVEALFEPVLCIHRIHSQLQDRISRQAFEASQSLYASGDSSSWYSTVVSWLLANGI